MAFRHIFYISSIISYIATLFLDMTARQLGAHSYAISYVELG